MQTCYKPVLFTFRWPVLHHLRAARCVWCVPVPCGLQPSGIHTTVQHNTGQVNASTGKGREMYMLKQKQNKHVKWMQHEARHMTCECVWKHAMCICVLDGEGSRVVASRALVVVWKAMYLTSYSDWLAIFHEPLSPPCRCCTDSKKNSRIRCKVVFVATSSWSKMIVLCFFRYLFGHSSTPSMSATSHQHFLTTPLPFLWWLE